MSQSNTIYTLLYHIINTTELIRYYNIRVLYQANANVFKLIDIEPTDNNDLVYIIQFWRFYYRKNQFSSISELPIFYENSQEGVLSVYIVHKTKELSFPVIIDRINERLVNPKYFPKIITK